MLRQSFRTAALLGMLVAIAACSPKSPSVDEAAVSERAETPRTKTVIDDQLKALDKAKAVQATLDKQNADADQAIKDAGG